MRNWILCGCLALLALTGRAQGRPDTSAYELANLREDLRLLQQRVGELSLNVEQLTRENSTLQAAAGRSYVTLAQLNQAVADLHGALRDGLAGQRQEVLAQMATQLEKLARQTQAALDALAKNQATRPALPAAFSEDYPKEGVAYTVQMGDTLDGIAKKTGARRQDIINANKLADPSRIRAGQTLFIPQGK